MLSETKARPIVYLRLVFGCIYDLIAALPLVWSPMLSVKTSTFKEVIVGEEGKEVKVDAEVQEASRCEVNYKPACRPPCNHW